MNIEVLAGNTVKITLNSSDMTDYDIKYESLSRKSPDTKRLLVELLSAVRLEKNLDLMNGRLFIEAFPRSDGGCMLYISSLTSTCGDDDDTESGSEHTAEKFLQPHYLICESESAEEIGGLCRSMSGLIGKARSALYASDGKQPLFRLLLSDKNAFSPSLKRLIAEYGRMLSTVDAAAETREYFKCVIAERAAEKAAKML